ncbi:MAG: MBL fold metallo-hydrolase [Ilumatobacteraceae bacterium]
MSSAPVAGGVRAPEAVVLGTGQDGGRPQIGCRRACCADADPVTPACLALIGSDGRRWLIDATPAIGEQLRLLDSIVPRESETPVIDGVLLTHGHLGHFTGLAQLGREALAADGVPVWAQPRLRRVLESDAPWSLLAEHGHVVFRDDPVVLGGGLSVEVLPVPHRDEISETVAFRVEGPTGSVLWLPDIDSWELWDRDVIDEVARVDVAYLDATFYDDGELDRDMSAIPHPRVVDTVTRFVERAPELAARVRLIHLNHTNPVLRPGSPERAFVEDAGLSVALTGERFTL